jgi:hypothetical protein
LRVNEKVALDLSSNIEFQRLELSRNILSFVVGKDNGLDRKFNVRNGLSTYSRKSDKKFNPRKLDICGPISFLHKKI